MDDPESEATAPVRALLDQLDLEELDVNLYRGDNPGERHNQRVFGGLVAAQAMRAATLTVGSEHHPHSLPGYFLRGGKPGRPIVFHVDRIRDGRSFTTRRVVAVQFGEAIFNLTASFQKPEDDGTDYQVGLPLDLPGPDEVPDRLPRDEAHAQWIKRSPGLRHRHGSGKRRNRPRARRRMDGGVRQDDVCQPRSCRVVPVRGTIHRQDGTLVASMAQEALIRRLRPTAIEPELG